MSLTRDSSPYRTAFHGKMIRNGSTSKWQNQFPAESCLTLGWLGPILPGPPGQIFDSIT
jgi:hypothetical protein